jgi:hypothetical protein
MVTVGVKMQYNKILLCTMALFCLAFQACAQSDNTMGSSGIGIKGNVGAAPIGIINNGASVYPVGEYGASVYPVGKYGASFWLREFVCNSMSACGMYDAARANDGAIVNLGGVKRGATVPNIDGSAVRLVSVAKAKS